jgi:predicted DNA-binding transcriptional regulator AlpA
MAMDTPEPLLTIKQTAALEGCSVAEIYNRLARSEYHAVKDGDRKTLIPQSSIIARRSTKLKPASYKPPREARPPP